MWEIGAGRGDWTKPGSSSFIISAGPVPRHPARAARSSSASSPRTRARGRAIGDGAATSTTTIHRRRPHRQLRRLPRPPARLGRLRRRRRHAPGQPRRAAPVRPGPEGDAGRRDHRATCARSATRAVRRSAAQRPCGHRALSSQGHRLRLDHRVPDGTSTPRECEGVDPDLRVRPFFAHGETISIREFVVGAFNAEMGLEAADPDLRAASAGGDVDDPVRHGARRRARHDRGAPPASADRRSRRRRRRQRDPDALVDYMEFYLLNYFKPAIGEQTRTTRSGPHAVRADRLHHLPRPGPDDRSRPPRRGRRDRLRSRSAASSTASSPPRRRCFASIDDGSGHPAVKAPTLRPLRRQQHLHRLQAPRPGPEFHERNYDGRARRSS